MGAYDFMWNWIQAGQIEDLREDIDKQKKTIEEMKAIMYNMALRIQALEKKTNDLPM